jgi:hypothetical protein
MIPPKHQALVKYAEDQAVAIPLKHQALVNLYSRSGCRDPSKHQAHVKHTEPHRDPF